MSLFSEQKAECELIISRMVEKKQCGHIANNEFCRVWLLSIAENIAVSHVVMANTVYVVLTDLEPLEDEEESSSPHRWFIPEEMGV